MPLPILELTTVPGAEPVSRDEAKANCRVDGTSEDALFDIWIAAARGQVEAYTNRALITQSWRVTLDDFPCAGKWLELPKPPFASLTKIEIRQADGTYALATADDFDVLKPAGPCAQPACLGPKPDKAWPVSEWAGLGRARIQFSAGYGAAADVPRELKAAILLLVADMFANREAQADRALTENKSVQWLLAPFRIHYV